MPSRCLQRFGFTGTFFLITAPIDAQNPDFLSWDQVEEMHAAGMKFEPHSYDHPDMRNRGFDFVVFQILAPKEAIEARTGETCRFFAYPVRPLRPVRHRRAALGRLSGARC